MSKYLWIWCLTNTIAIALLLVAIGCNTEYDNAQDDRLTKIEYNIRECQGYMQTQPDTIVINVYNNINTK